MAEEKPAPKSGGSDILFFIGIILFFFIIWVAGGGPERPISFTGPYLTPFTGPGTGGSAYGDPNQFGSVNGTVSIGLGGVGYTGSNSGISILKDSTGPKQGSEDKEYLTVMVSQSISGPVSTAGWKLVSRETGVTAPFPSGSEVPRSGRINESGAIVLKPGDQAIVVSGRSPVGTSFRENVCTGYFEERQDFSPALSQSCPTPYQEMQRFYGDASQSCQDYVRAIPYCATETKASGEAGGSCMDFVDEYLNYNGCVDAHRSDPNFSSGTWRVFLGASDDLWKSEKETIQLLDASGNVLDSFSY